MRLNWGRYGKVTVCTWTNNRSATLCPVLWDRAQKSDTPPLTLCLLWSRVHGVRWKMVITFLSRYFKKALTLDSEPMNSTSDTNKTQWWGQLVTWTPWRASIDDSLPLGWHFKPQFGFKPFCVSALKQEDDEVKNTTTTEQALFQHTKCECSQYNSLIKGSFCIGFGSSHNNKNNKCFWIRRVLTNSSITC